MASLFYAVPLALVVALIIACQTETAECAPLWFEQLVDPYERPYYPTYNSRPRQQGSRQLGGKQRYKNVCRTIHADNYAFPGKIPFPSAPFCPY